jgi:hypothetical protein
MAKVYTGKVIIPGDRIDEFFKVMREAEEKRDYGDTILILKTSK